MAAALICGRRTLLSLRNAAGSSLLKTPKRHEGFYVLLPEIGDDLSEKIHPLLRDDVMLPEFNQVTIEKCIAATAKQTVEFENKLKALEKDIKESEEIDIFKDVLHQIEKFQIPIITTWGISKLLYYGYSSLMPTNYFMNIHKRSSNALCIRYTISALYEACKKANQESKNLTDEQKRILEKYILECELNGMELSEKNRVYLGHMVNRLKQRTHEFTERSRYATNIFARKITNPHTMRGFPKEFLQAVAADPEKYEVGPWIITLDNEIVQTYMEYCPDPMERLNIWLAKVTKCSPYGEQDMQTTQQINGITGDRDIKARMLGYKHHADMSMKTKMAGSLENVYTFLEDLRKTAYPRQVKEMNELVAFARERGFEGKLNHWDVPYWMRKQKRTLYNYDEEMLKEYFPLERVMDGLLKLLRSLFNVEIVERDTVDVWHRDVRFFDVYDLDVSSVEPAGSFYFDPYARDEGKFSGSNTALVLLIRNGSKIENIKPLSSLMFNFQQPAKNGPPSLLNIKGVESLFENFGHLLQQILTKVESMEVAGLSFVEWDATGTSKYLMPHFLYEPSVLKSISGHYNTDESLDDTMVDNLRSARNHMSGYRLCKELYLSKLDLDLHSKNDSWEKLMKEGWKEHFVISQDKRDYHICSWDAIFVEEYGAAYYSNLWSRMLSADVYSTFQESQVNDLDQREIAKRFKDTFLALGGSLHASEVFRRFRGRDPSLKALIKSLNLH